MCCALIELYLEYYIVHQKVFVKCGKDVKARDPMQPKDDK